MNFNGPLLIFGPLLLTVISPTVVFACRPSEMDGMVVKKSTFGAVAAPNAAEADEAVAAGEDAKLAARRYFGLELEPMLIASPDYFLAAGDLGCAIQVPWPFYGRSGTQKLPRYVMPHEIGHVIFIKYIVPPSGKSEYGGMAPDWLDEMAALAFEGKEGADERRRFATKLAFERKLITAQRLFAMTHPEWRGLDEQVRPIRKLVRRLISVSGVSMLVLPMSAMAQTAQKSDQPPNPDQSEPVFLGPDGEPLPPEKQAELRRKYKGMLPKNSHNADTFRPYNPQEAIGDLSPTNAKPPKKPKCGGSE